MNIWMVRDDCTETRTFGTMRFPDGYVCQTLEDQVRPAGVKIAGETAIPAGTYPVTITMSARFGKMLPAVSNVPNFTGVRIHSGNRTEDTSGCVLVATTRGHHDDLVSSREAMEQVQQRIAAALLGASGTCTLTIVQAKVETTEAFQVG
jgi:hypothetical protein